MSLKNDIVNAEIMLTDLTRRAENKGVNIVTYIWDMGEVVKERRFVMAEMDFMTFYTCSEWMNQVVMVLGIYQKSEIDLSIDKPSFYGKDDEGVVYIVSWLVEGGMRKTDMVVVPSVRATNITDGWSGIGKGVKYKINSGGLFINWRTYPLSSSKE